MINKSLLAARFLLEEFYKIDVFCSILTIEAFLVVAENEGCVQKDVAVKLGDRKQQTLSKSILILANKEKRKSKDYGLIIQHQNPQNLREYELYLTPKGKKLYNKFLELGG